MKKKCKNVIYVVKLPEPANKSSRSPVDPPQLLHPNPRETNEDGTAIIKAILRKQSYWFPVHRLLSNSASPSLWLVRWLGMVFWLCCVGHQSGPLCSVFF